jgi:hypothetical protein
MKEKTRGMIYMRLSSEDKTIISSGVVLAFKENSDVVFDFTEDGLKLKLRLTFKRNDDLKQTILVLTDNKNPEYIEFQCTNFSDIGTGTSQPIELGNIGGKKIYLNFWSYLDGDLNGKARTRKIEYTVYQEER